MVPSSRHLIQMVPSSKLAMNLKDFAFDFAACASIMLFHFTNYIVYAEYDRLYPDVLIVAGQLCLVAIGLTFVLKVPSRVLRAAVFALLITVVFSDALFEFGTNDNVTTRLIMLSATLLAALGIMFFLRDRANIVVLGGSLSMFVATLVIGILAFRSHEPSIPAAQIESSGAKPVLVHIILDEHIGVAGIPANVSGGVAAANALRDFYLSSGFRVFSGAYSPFFQTEHALANALNFDASDGAHQYLTRKRYGFKLDQNAYLKTYADRGKPIRIYQSDYLDLCDPAVADAGSCHTYRPDQIASATIAELQTAERARLLLNMYYSSFAVVKILKLGENRLNRWLVRQGKSPRHLKLWHGRVGPIATAPIFERLLNDLSRARNGEVFFAHLLNPHYPYAYNADCSIRSPISSWRLRQQWDKSNSRESRILSYQQYFDQLACIRKRINKLFDTMKSAGTFEDATIVIHGDHGSRIGLRDPDIQHAGKMTPEDYADSFSTLFALRSPDVKPGIDNRMLPLPSLVEHALKGPEASISPPTRPTVFIADKKNGFTQFPLPPFSATQTMTTN